ELLPVRISHYEPAWLDEECLAGRLAWARLTPRVCAQNGGARRAGPVKSTPITLLPRRHAGIWAALAGAAEASEPSGQAQTVLDFIRHNGASFFEELV